MGCGPALVATVLVTHCQLSEMDGPAGTAVLEAEGQQLRGPLAFSAIQMEGAGEYRLGIIDPLQRYNFKKKLERYFKMLVKCRCKSKIRNGMSVVPPPEYARRFHKMVGMKLLGFSDGFCAADWEEESALQQADSSRNSLADRPNRTHSNRDSHPRASLASAASGVMAERTGQQHSSGEI